MSRLRLTTEQFIEKAKKAHGNKYDYSKVEYQGCRIKIIIICSIHGEFTQMPYCHSNGQGCRSCGKESGASNRRKTLKQFIKEANEKHGGKYDYSLVKYNNNRTKIIIICPTHGEFKQIPSDHLNGSGCSDCGGYGPTNTRKFIDRARKKHGDKYNYDNVIYINVFTKVTIICPDHGEFKQKPSSHTSGYGCAECGGVRRKTQEEFIKQAETKHNNKYNYDNVEYKNVDTKITIVCPDHGEFTQTPYCHLQGQGCPLCARQYKASKLRKTMEQFIKQAQEMHGDKYDYSLVNYVNCNTKVIIICPNHGKFEQKPVNHINRSQGCIKCLSCRKCGLWRIWQNKLCSYCKPRIENKMYKKTKEYAVVKYLKEKLPDDEFIHNKSVGKDCTKGHLFPDIRFDCLSYQLIVEVDEHKHRGANYKCDEQRMYDIIAKLGQPCVFIRYNPDGKDNDKKVLLNEIKNNLYQDGIGFNHVGLKTVYLYY